MKGKVLATVLCLVLAPMAAQAFFEVGVRGSYWRPKLSGDLRVDDGSKGTEVDVKDDLGMDDEDVPFGEVFLGIGNHHLSLGGARFDYSGNGNLAGVTFGGITYSGKVDSSLKYDMLDLAYQWDALNLENVLAGFSIGPILQVKYLDGDVKMSGVESGTGLTAKTSESFQLPIPMVGLGLHVGILAKFLEARVRGVGMGYQGDRILDLQGEVYFNYIPFLEIVGGYRYIDIDVDRQNVLLKYTQSGPYVGLALKVGI